jgi:hypothetical protein
VKYRVNFRTLASMSVLVDAEDEDAAVDVAFTRVPHGVCAQCSGWSEEWSLDMGEWNEV